MRNRTIISFLTAIAIVLLFAYMIAGERKAIQQYYNYSTTGTGASAIDDCDYEKVVLTYIDDSDTVTLLVDRVLIHK